LGIVVVADYDSDFCAAWMHMKGESKKRRDDRDY